MNPLNVLVYNAIRTPDGTVLSSKHDYDYQKHRDKNGHSYAVDGGIGHLHAIRRQGNGEEVSLNLFTFDDITKIREVFAHSDVFFGIIETKYLKDIPDDFLDYIIKYSPIPWKRILFLREKQYRNLEQNQITII